MEPLDAETFFQRLVALAELFDAKLSESKSSLYFEALRDLPMAAVVQAMNRTAQTCTFMPRPADIRKLAVGDSEDQAEVAWMAFKRAATAAGSYASLVLDDAALADTLIAVFGGWPEACAADFSPEMWSSKRKEFGRVYRVLRDRGVGGRRYLPGVCERTNSGRADWLSFVEVKRIGTSGDVQTLTAADAEEARTLLSVVASGLSRIDAASTLDRLMPERQGETA